MPTIYLAGPITGQLSDTVFGWREWVAQQLPGDVTTISPLRGKEAFIPQGETVQNTYEGTLWGSAKSITRRDMFDVRRCDVLLAVLGGEQVSIGTMLEIGAAYALRKAIVLVIEPGSIYTRLGAEPGRIHGMLDDMADFVVSTLDEAMKLLALLLAGGRE